MTSPSVFQRFKNEVFREFLHHFIIIYIYDILIYSRNLDEHCLHVMQVLQKFREYQLYLKLEVLVPPQDYSLPRLCYQLAWHRDGPAEGTNIPRLATILLSQGLAMFSVTISYH